MSASSSKANRRDPWTKYAVGNPSTRPNWVEPDCVPCTEVSHVSHVESALRIVEAGAIRQGLVFDESRLNTERILVTWLSPNHWTHGFRYGNVRFTFDFAQLVEGKNYYWVEDITSYSPTACRILITSNDHSSRLSPYDPTKANGPWWFDVSSKKHYYNGNYCLEFMMEDEQRIRKAISVDFVTHHSDYCSIHRTSPKSCGERGMNEGKGGARFLMMAAGRGVVLSALNKSLITDNGGLSHEVTNAIEWIACSIHKVEYQGKVGATTDTGRAVARAVLNALAIDQRDEAHLLASLFRSEERLLQAIADVIADSLDWDDVNDIRRVLA